MAGESRRNAEARAAQDPGAFGVGRLFWLTSEAIVGADLSSNVIMLWNPAAERLFGYSAEEALGMRLEALVPEDLRARHLAGIARYRDMGEVVLVGGPPVDLPAVTKEGSMLDVALSLTDVSDGPHRRHVLAVIRDMTAVRKAERALQMAMDATGEFVAAASHDLRSPLTSVMGFANTLLEFDDRFPPEKRREFLEAISRGATQASRLVDDLLTLSQIQAGALPSNPQDCRLVEAVREAIMLSGVGASVDVGEDLRVEADSHHLERILMNYLTNAAHYGAEPISVVAHVDSTAVSVEVRDQGPGVPEEFVPRLFSRFARADPSSSGGTGLGLSIVRGLALANGGDTYYHLAHGGACFGVRLPIGKPMT